MAVTDAKNRVTQRELETLLLEMELADGYQPQEYTLDAIDWTKVLYPVDMPLRVVSLDAPRTRTEYSKDGRVLAEIDELGNRTQYEYNPLGQLIKVTYPEIEGNSSSISTEYDSAGRRIKETDALGNTVEYKYDKLGRAIEVIFEDESSNQTTFDSLGRRTQSIDQEGIITNYEYDKLGRLSAVVQKVS
ncbi:MAG: RHS repeat protein, partial [Roseofilum sp. Belize Diploria]